MIDEGTYQPPLKGAVIDAACIWDSVTTLRFCEDLPVKRRRFEPKCFPYTDLPPPKDGFFCRRLQPGEVFETRTEHEEVAFVILAGTCLANWGRATRQIGMLKNVFDGLPYTVPRYEQKLRRFTAQLMFGQFHGRQLGFENSQPRVIVKADQAEIFGIHQSTSFLAK